MIVRIPEDIHSYESKSFGNFTIRQIVCLVLGFLVIAPTWWAVFALTGSVDLSGIPAFFVGIPICFCGFIKKHGVYLEKILIYRYKAKFKHTQKRPYHMSNLYEDVQKKYIEVTEYENEQKLQQEKTDEKIKSKHDKTHALERKKNSTR